MSGQSGRKAPWLSVERPDGSGAHCSKCPPPVYSSATLLRLVKDITLFCAAVGLAVLMLSSSTGTYRLSSSSSVSLVGLNHHSYQHVLPLLCLQYFQSSLSGVSPILSLSTHNIVLRSIVFLPIRHHPADSHNACILTQDF